MGWWSWGQLDFFRWHRCKLRGLYQRLLCFLYLSCIHQYICSSHLSFWGRKLCIQWFQLKVRGFHRLGWGCHNRIHRALFRLSFYSQWWVGSYRYHRFIFLRWMRELSMQIFWIRRNSCMRQKVSFFLLHSNHRQVWQQLSWNLSYLQTFRFIQQVRLSKSYFLGTWIFDVCLNLNFEL